MSRSVDERIVEMEFDNRQFESNVKTSMSTLDKLKEALNFDDAANGLDGLGKATKNFKFDGISDAIESVKNRFSALGIIGMTVLQNITNAALNAAKGLLTAIPKQIMSGGWSRAMNLENAHFQLMGLVKDEAQVKAVMEDVDYAVSGTAYGLDAAAKVASQLAASGLRAGDNMKNALRGISGVAAMTNSEYEDIGRIFATVAGNGRLMGDQLNQLAVRGINAAAILAEKFGVTEGELREMVSKGKIDFQTFANAMDEAFGEHAKDANKTFDGVLRNIKAALSRIGAEFATPFIQNAIEPLNRIREKINEIKAAIAPLYKTFAQLAPIVSKVLNDKIANLKFGWLNNISKGILNVFSGILLAIMPIRDAFKDIFPPATLHQLTDFSAKFVAFTEKMLISEHTASNLQHIFRGVFSVFDILGQAISAVVKALSPLTAKFKEYGNIALNVLAILGEFVVYTANYIRENDLFTKAINAAVEKVREFISVIREHGIPILEIFKDGFGRVLEVLKGISPAIDHFFSQFGRSSEGKFNPFIAMFDLFSKAANGFFSLFEKGVPGFFKLLLKLKTGVHEVITMFNEFITGGDLGQALKDSTFAVILYQLKNIIVQIRLFGKGLLDSTGIADLLSSIRGAFVSWQKSLDAKYLLSIAGAIAILVVAMKLMSTIPADRMVDVGASMGMLAMELLGFVEVIGALKQGALRQTAGTIIAIAASVLILATAAKSLAAIPFDQMQLGILGVLELLGMVSVVVAGLSYVQNDLPKISGALLGISVAILILSKAVEAFSKLTWDELKRGLTSVTILLGEFVLVALGLDKMKADLPKGATGLIAMAGAVLLLSKAVKAFGTMDFNVLVQGMVSVMLLLAELAVVGAILGDCKHIFAAGVATLAMAAALKILAGVVEQLGSLAQGPLEQGLLSILALLLEIGAFGKIMGSNAGSFLVVSVALDLFAAALVVLAAAVGMFGSMQLETILKGILGLGAALLVFGGLAVLLAPFTLELLALAGAVALIGAGVGIASLGIAALSVALTTLAASGTVIGELLITTLGQIGTGLGQLFVNLANVIKEKIDAIVEAARVVIGAIITVITEYVPKIASAAFELVKAIVNAIRENLPELITKGLEIVQNFIRGITEGLPALIQAAFEFVITFINGLAEGLRANQDQLIAAIDNLMDAVINALIAYVDMFIENGKQFIGGLINGLTNSDEDPVETVDKIISDIIGGITGRIKDVVQAGADFVNGFVDGLRNAKDAAIRRAAEFGSSVISAFRSRDGIDANSPSRAMMAAASDYAAGFTTQLAKEEGGTRRSVLDYVQNGIVEPVEEKSETVRDLLNNMFAGSGKGVKEFASRYLGDLIPALDEGNEALEENQSALSDTEKAVASFGDQVSDTSKSVKKDTEEAAKKCTTLAEKVTYFFDHNTEMLADYANRFTEINHNYLDGLGEIYGAAAQEMFTSPYIPDWDLNVAYDALTMLGEHFYLMSDDAKKAAEEAGVSLDQLQFGIEEVSDALIKARQDIVDNIKSQMNIFDEFERKTDLTAEEVLKNMQSQVDGVAEWSANLEKLALRGIDQGLLMHLAELGPKGFEYVNAFVQMSGEQLDRAGVLYQQSLIVPEAAANQILSSYAFAGWNAATGYTQGLNNGRKPAADEAQALAQDTLNALTGPNGLDENSPSKKTYAIGEYFDQGFINGINGKKLDTVTAAHNLCENVRKVSEDSLNPEIFKVIGMNMDIGLANGIYAKAIEPINAAIEVAKRTIESLKEFLGINSPSTVGIELGKYLMLGFGGGISDNADEPLGAVRDMTSMIMNALSSTEDILNNSDSLVITPVLDLSNVYAGAQEIGNVIGGQSVGLRGFGSTGTYLGTGSTTNNSAVNTFNINVTGGPNSNPREIADEVINRLNAQLVRGKVVYA